MARPKTRLRAQNPLNPAYAANNARAKLSKHTLSDTHQLQRYVARNRGNPFAYLCRVIAGTAIVCSWVDEKTGEIRDIKMRATIPQRTEAARILAAKMLPDLKALNVSDTQQVNVDISRLNTTILLSYLAEMKIDLRDVGVGEKSKTEAVEQLDYQKTCESDDSSTPIQEVRTSEPAPRCAASAPQNVPPEQLQQLVPLADLPAGRDKPEPAATWTPRLPPAELDTD